MADTGAMDWLCMEEVMAKTNSSGREGGKMELLKLLEEERRRGKGEEEERGGEKGGGEKNPSTQLVCLGVLSKELTENGLKKMLEILVVRFGKGVT